MKEESKRKAPPCILTKEEAKRVKATLTVPASKKSVRDGRLSVQPYGRKPQNAKFPGKLRELLRDPRWQDAIRWDDGLRGIVLANPERIARDVLPHYFSIQTGKDIFKSFRRQLIYYGFEDVKHRPTCQPGLPRSVSVCVNRDATIKSLDDFDRVLRYVPPRKSPPKLVTPPPAEKKSTDSSDGVSNEGDDDVDDAASSTPSHEANSSSSLTEDDDDPPRRPTTLQTRHLELYTNLVKAQALAQAAEATCHDLRNENTKLRHDNLRLRTIAGLAPDVCCVCHSEAKPRTLKCNHRDPTCDACAVNFNADDCAVCLLLALARGAARSPGLFSFDES
ncbi:hypothetical protein CTAYLR_006146 [Chrysophaeum taylorii]|uniref:HSF-type DNA-binding domain-containing protein n=1 Tax=Chrysophaeum taylorii TaxID=2483200 RepID=A0AAD7UQK4_9STRA|nr:hypothetical protein CTAYLR_006146 [Chrysophaeum taylorii]